jgi:putative transposase
MKPIGWHSRGYLPHFDAPGVLQTVTFRLVDTLPAAIAKALPADNRRTQRIDDELDRGAGACWLGQPVIARLVQHALLTFDGARYRLLAWCVMPNHVHVLVEPIGAHRLGDIVRSWKSYTGRHANYLLGRSGAFWAADYFDRYIRNERHYVAARHYIEHNPVKARLVDRAEDWPWSSAGRQAAPDTSV